MLPRRSFGFGLSFILSLLLAALFLPSPLAQSGVSAPRPAPSTRVYLPLLAGGRGTCPFTSVNEYRCGTAYQYDLDDPVRPAARHADKNIELRDYTVATNPVLRRELVDYGCYDQRAPLLTTLFEPPRVPTLTELYRVHDWMWAQSPELGRRGEPMTHPPVTALGLGTEPGETLYVPRSGYDIGGGMEVIVLYADRDTIALRYGREDSVGGPPRDYAAGGGPGYVVHIDSICTDPNLLSLYRDLDDPDGPRYAYVPPKERPYTYPLPILPAGHPIGAACGTEAVVAVVDTGVFQDPRSLWEFWSPHCPGDRVHPLDTDYANQWALETIDAPRAWTLSTGENTVVAVLDTGVDVDHPDLQEKLLLGLARDFVNGDVDPDDDHDLGHGTHVTGIAAAATDNDLGMAGLGWDTRILPLKVLDDEGNGYLYDIESAIRYATDNGADVINLSLGPLSAIPCPSTLQDAVNYAHAAGVSLVASGGNFPNIAAPEIFPANCDHVLGVSATDRDDEEALYSNSGAHLSVAAPGGTYACETCAIYSTVPGGGYGWLQGTSMSAPHVSGLSALLLARYPDYTPDQVASAILDNAVDLGSPGWDEHYGCGRIDAYASLLVGARGPASLCLAERLQAQAARPQAPSPLTTEAPFAPGQIVVELRPGTAPPSLDLGNAVQVEQHASTKLLLLDVPVGSELALLAQLRAHPAVLHADLNYLVFVQ